MVKYFSIYFLNKKINYLKIKMININDKYVGKEV